MYRKYFIAPGILCSTRNPSSGIFRANKHDYAINQPAFTCSNLTIETLEQGVKYVQS